MTVEKHETTPVKTDAVKAVLNDSEVIQDIQNVTFDKVKDIMDLTDKKLDLISYKLDIRKSLLEDKDLYKTSLLFADIYNSFIQKLKKEKLTHEIKKTYEEIDNFFTSWSSTVEEIRSLFLDNETKELENDLKIMRNSLEQGMKEKIIQSSGVDIENAWNVLINEYPDLKQLNIKSKTASENNILLNTAGYFEKPSSFNDRISIVLAEDSINPDYYRGLMEKRRTSVKSAANIIGIEPSKMTPELLKLFIFLHEVGHAHDYIINYSDKKNSANLWKEASDTQLSELPVPNVNPSALMRIINENKINNLPVDAQKKIKDGQQKILIKEQEEAYRNLPKENFADQFAADYIKKHILKTSTFNE